MVFVVFLLATLAATVLGLASGWDSASGEGTPSGTTIAVVGGSGLILLAVVALVFAALNLLTTNPVAPEVFDRARFGAAWAFSAAFLLMTTLGSWAHFLPLSDYAKPVVQLFLSWVSALLVFAAGRLFHQAIPGFSLRLRADVASQNQAESSV